MYMCGGRPLRNMGTPLSAGTCLSPLRTSLCPHLGTSSPLAARPAPTHRTLRMLLILVLILIIIILLLAFIAQLRQLQCYS